MLFFLKKKKGGNIAGRRRSAVLGGGGRGESAGEGKEGKELPAGAGPGQPLLRPGRAGLGPAAGREERRGGREAGRRR